MIKPGDEVLTESGESLGTVTAVTPWHTRPGVCSASLGSLMRHAGVTKPRICPYDEDVNDTKTECYCCAACAKDCTDDI